MKMVLIPFSNTQLPERAAAPVTVPFYGPFYGLDETSMPVPAQASFGVQAAGEGL